MDANNLKNDLNSLDGFLRSVKEKRPLEGEHRDRALYLLEQYECWGPYFELIKIGLVDPKTSEIKDFTNLARVQNLYLEDVFSAAETCSLLVSDKSISHSYFTENVLSQILEEEDYTAESSIRSTVWPKFKEGADKVACLERLCLLFEKKMHSAENLAETYETLLEVDPNNLKALRYFKLVYAQNNDWEDVVKYLNRILSCVKHKSEKFRVAQELAVILLYQLDLPEESIEIIEKFCSESPLDTSTILYDAYHRIARWQGCLGVLRESLLGTDEDSSRAVLHFKIGGILEILEDHRGAMENYQKAAGLWPEFIDAYEGVINTALQLEEFELVLDWLEKVESHLRDDTLLEQLQQAAKRLKDGMEQAANG